MPIYNSTNIIYGKKISIMDSTLQLLSSVVADNVGSLQPAIAEYKSSIISLEYFLKDNDLYLFYNSLGPVRLWGPGLEHKSVLEIVRLEESLGHMENCIEENRIKANRSFSNVFRELERIFPYEERLTKNQHLGIKSHFGFDHDRFNQLHVKHRSLYKG
jgi:hypothetical protein